MRCALILLLLAVGGCAVSSKTPVTSTSSDADGKRGQTLKMLTGTWRGSQPTVEGGSYTWTSTRLNVGLYVMQYRLVGKSGDVRTGVEYGEWGASGNIEFSIFKGWLQDGQCVASDPSDATVYDAYEILTLTADELRYREVNNGAVFMVKRLDRASSDIDELANQQVINAAINCLTGLL